MQDDVAAAGAAWTLMHLGPALLPPAADERSILPVVLESLRLHPPTWLIRRVCVRAVELGGYRFEAGHTFLISPYVIHRDDAVFADPEHFDPRRWATTPVSAMLAFGRGIHRCPGQDAGLMMITAAVGYLHEAYELHVPAGRRVTPDPRTSLIPAGLLVDLTSRRLEDSGRRD